jgi:hypothetical protein
VKRKVYTQEKLDSLATQARLQMETLTMLKRLRADKELLRRTAALYVKLNREWQKAKYGRVRQHLSVEKLAANHG